MVGLVCCVFVPFDVAQRPSLFTLAAALAFGGWVGLHIATDRRNRLFARLDLGMQVLAAVTFLGVLIPALLDWELPRVVRAVALLMAAAATRMLLPFVVKSRP